MPAFNEAAVLAETVGRIRQVLRTLPYEARVIIADNASTDATPDIAAGLAAAHPDVRVVRIATRGRGVALRTAWATSTADVLAYTDADLSTGLDALAPLVAAVAAGHSDLAIGSRLLPGARVRRGLKREVISRSYNRLLRIVLRVQTHDAQCGFKAISARAARHLLPLVQDEGWFFDTELIVLAQRAGFRVLEIPVDWVDDPNSSVALAATARDDLRGVWRLLRHRNIASPSSSTEGAP